MTFSIHHEIRHGSTRKGDHPAVWITATVDLSGVQIHNVRASRRGVIWPARYLDAIVTFTDDALRHRLEAELKRLAAEAEEVRRLPAEVAG